VLVGAIAVVLFQAATAGAAIQIGQVPSVDPTESFVGGVNMVQDSTGAAPAYQVPPGGGVITSWRHRGDAVTPGSGRLQLWTPTGDPDDFVLAGRSGVETFTAGASNPGYESLTETADAVGRMLGLAATDGAGFTTGVLGDVYRFDGNPTDPVPGDLVGLFNPTSSLRVNVAASLEPDCDSDGFGDETQDPNTSSCDPPQPADTTAPDTTITKGPKRKVKTKKKRKKATFEFTSNEPASTFECSLDDGPFEPCTSPEVVKVKRGKHTFDVGAKDAAGNADPTPATQSWKVKKKK